MRRDAAARSGRADGTAFSVQGAGRALVLVHGVGMARAIWAPQVAELCRSHTVVTYDLLGHGESALPPERATLADYAAQLKRLLDALAIDAADVVGHSMGALVALEFALTHATRTLKVATLNAVFERTAQQRNAVEARAAALEAEGPAASVEATLRRWFGDPVPPPMREPAALAGRLLKAADPVGYARTYRLFARADRAHGDRLPGLAAPAWFMTGEHDLNSTPAMSQAMARLAPAGEARVIAGAGHMMNVTHPKPVTGALIEWLETARR